MTTYLLKADLPPNTRLMDLVLTGGAGGKVTVIPIEAAYPADDPTALRGLEAEPPLRSIADEPLYRRVDMLETEIKHLADMEQRADADMSRRIEILENLLDKAFAMLVVRAREEEGFDILGCIRKLESWMYEVDLAKAMNETLIR